MYRTNGLHVSLAVKRCPTAKLGLMLTLLLPFRSYSFLGFIKVGTASRGGADRLQNCRRNRRAYVAFGQSNECYLDLTWVR